jgi:hypothetical protein
LEAKENLEVETLTVLVDKGYHNEKAMQKKTTISSLLSHTTPGRQRYKRNIC